MELPLWDNFICLFLSIETRLFCWWWVRNSCWYLCIHVCVVKREYWEWTIADEAYQNWNLCKDFELLPWRDGNCSWRCCTKESKKVGTRSLSGASQLERRYEWANRDCRRNLHNFLDESPVRKPPKSGWKLFSSFENSFEDELVDYLFSFPDHVSMIPLFFFVPPDASTPCHAISTEPKWSNKEDTEKISLLIEPHHQDYTYAFTHPSFSQLLLWASVSFGSLNIQILEAIKTGLDW